MQLFLRDVPLGKALVRKFPRQGVQHRRQRDHQQHSEHAHQLAADGDRHQHPHTGQADGGSHHSGVNQVVFQLLQNQEHRHEGQRLQGVIHQNEERAQHAAHERAHHRHQCRHRDDDADQRNVGHPENRHGHGEQAAQNAGLQALPGNKIREGAVGQPQNPDDLVAGFLRNQGIENPPPLPRQNFLPRQTVNGKGDADHQIHNTAGHASDHIHRAAHHRGHLIAQKAHGILQYFRPFQTFQVGDLHDPGLHVRIVVHQLHQLCRRLLNKGRDALRQGGHCYLNLGRQHFHHEHDDQRQGRNGQHNGKHPAQSLLVNAVQLPLNGAHRHIEHEGDGCPRHKWRYQIPYRLCRIARLRRIQQNPRKNETPRRQKEQPAQQLFVYLHFQYPLFA